MHQFILYTLGLRLLSLLTTAGLSVRWLDSTATTEQHGTSSRIHGTVVQGLRMGYVRCRRARYSRQSRKVVVDACYDGGDIFFLKVSE